MKSRVWYVHFHHERVPRRIVLDEKVTRQQVRPHLLKALGIERMPGNTNIYVPLDDSLREDDD